MHHGVRRVVRPGLVPVGRRTTAALAPALAAAASGALFPVSPARRIRVRVTGCGGTLACPGIGVGFLGGLGPVGCGVLAAVCLAATAAGA